MTQTVTFLSPIVGGQDQPLNWSFNHPKNVTIAELPGKYVFFTLKVKKMLVKSWIIHIISSPGRVLSQTCLFFGPRNCFPQKRWAPLRLRIKRLSLALALWSWECKDPPPQEIAGLMIRDYENPLVSLNKALLDLLGAYFWGGWHWGGYLEFPWYESQKTSYHLEHNAKHRRSSET